MKQTADVINALAALAWPILAGLVIWRLLPTIRKIADSRGFTIKVGSAELTVQEVSQKLLETTAQIQDKLATVSAAAQPPRSAATPPSRVLRHILWVDDKPSNNAYEAAQLQTLGVRVTAVTSTDAGIAALTGGEAVDAVISDLARSEPGGYQPDAGIDLIRKVRDLGIDTPIFVYASQRGVRMRDTILAAGGNGVAASTPDLFALLRGIGVFPQPDGA